MAKKILIVDDEEHILVVLEKRLVSAGYAVLKAVNGSQAIDLAKKEVPALVITDLNMPDMDGCQMIDALESDPVTKDIPAIILTALIRKGEEEKKTQYISRRRSLAKPYDPEELLRVIAETLALYEKA